MTVILFCFAVLLAGAGIGLLLGAVGARCSGIIAERQAEDDLEALIRGSRK